MVAHDDRVTPVVLLGGASGTGKSEIAYPLARRLQVPVVEVDDLVVALQELTTAEQQPVLHHWRRHPQTAARWSAERIVAQQIAIARVLAPAAAAVIGNHLATGLPVVLEGDYLLPELATRREFAGQPAAGRVRAVFLREPDADQIAANYRRREPDAGDQRWRAEVSARYGDWLAAECGRHGVPVVDSRPWVGSVERVLAALAG